MTVSARAIRRGLLLGCVTLAMIFSATSPAGASLSAERTLQTTIATTTVAAPGNVSTAGSLCLLVFTATISWTPSDSRGVTGYTVTAHFGDGTSSLVAQTDATTTSVTRVYARINTVYAFTVTTHTGYGWTAESGKTPAIRC